MDYKSKKDNVFRNKYLKKTSMEEEIDDLKESYKLGKKYYEDLVKDKEK